MQLAFTKGAHFPGGLSLGLPVERVLKRGYVDFCYCRWHGNKHVFIHRSGLRVERKGPVWSVPGQQPEKQELNGTSKRSLESPQNILELKKKLFSDESKLSIWWKQTVRCIKVKGLIRDHTPNSLPSPKPSCPHSWSIILYSFPISSGPQLEFLGSCPMGIVGWPVSLLWN